MTYSVYILYSQKLDRYYIGTTDNVTRRFEEHNTGRYENAFTTKGVPWRLCLSYELKDSSKAYKLEHFIKRMKSKRFIEKIINDSRVLDDIVLNKIK